VLNLVHDSDKKQLIQEIFRVVKAGGRVAISDIVSDEPVPQHLKDDAQLWSGCISGALLEHDFLQAFVEAGFVAVTLDKWDAQPWQVVEGIEFRAVTITATKPQPVPCLDKGHAVIYKGSFSKVYDDEGHVFYRGQRMAVCERSYQLLTSDVYGEQFIGIAPTQEQSPQAWHHKNGALRPVTDTKSAARSSDNPPCCC
jgi:SAM-dependent methyltransferase